MRAGILSISCSLLMLLFTNAALAETSLLQFDFSTTDSSGNLLDTLNSHTGYMLPAGTPPTIVGSGPTGKYLHFDGSASYLSVDSTNTSSASILNASSFAIDVQFRILGDHINSTAYDREYIIGDNRDCCDDTASKGVALYASRTSGEAWKLTASIGTSDGSSFKRNELTTTSSLSVNRWYKAQLVYDGKSISIYLDGSLEARKSLVGFFVQGQHPVTLGRLAYGNYFQLNGDIAYVGIAKNISTFDGASRAIGINSDLSFSFDATASISGNTISFNNGGRISAQATLSGGSLQGNGIRGQAVYINGDSAAQPKLTVQRDPFSTPMGYSVSFWFKSDDCDQRALLTEPGVMISTRNGKLYTSMTTNQGSSDIESATIIKPGVWYNVALVSTGTNLQLYVNGLLINDSALPGYISRSGSSVINIGSPVTAGGISYKGFKGILDELRTFSHALSETEIRRLFRLNATSQALTAFEFDPARGVTKNTGLGFADLTLNTGVTADPAGFYNGALHFDGNNSATVGNSAGTTLLAQSFTFATWVKADTVGGNYQYIFSNDRDMSGTTPGGFGMRIDPSRRLTGFIELVGSNGAKTTLQSSTLVNAGTWYHVAMTFDASSLKLYVNGILEKTVTPPAGSTMITPPFNLTLGSLAFNAPQWYRLTGSIDEAVLIDRALTAQEVQSIGASWRVSTVPSIRNDAPIDPIGAWDSWPVNAIGSAPVLVKNAAQTSSIGLPTNSGLNIAAAPAEFESGSFVVEAGSTSSITVSSVSLPSGLNGSVRLVKSWYQSASNNELNTLNGNIKSVNETTDASDRMLRPELLLNNPDLIQPDPQTRTNFILDGDGALKQKPTWPADAATLQPVTIAPKSIQQFWMTIRGSNQDVIGNISFAANGNSASIPLYVASADRVVLPQPVIDYNIYYLGYVDGLCSGFATDSNCVVGNSKKTDAQYLAEMKNLHEHGVDAPGMYAWGRFTDTSPFAAIDHEMQLRQLAGLSSENIMFLGFAWRYGEFDQNTVMSSCTTGSGDSTVSTANTPACQAKLSGYKNNVAALLNHFDQHNYPQPLIYGVDEAYGNRLIATIPIYQAIHDIGGKTTVAVYKDYYSTLQGAQPGAGSLIDVPVISRCDGADDCQLALNVLPASVAPWLYNYPQVAIEYPFTYRHNFGLWTWAKGLKGVAPWAYQSGFGNPWYDFDRGNPTYDWFRDEIFAYPTANGVIDTIQWEGFREAVDDVRYLTRLLTQLGNANAAGLGGNDVVSNAQSFVTELRNRLLQHSIDQSEMDGIRTQINRYSAHLNLMGLN